MTEHMTDREFHLDVEADLDLVWNALTTREGLSSWYVVEADVDPRPGGVLRLDWGTGPTPLGVLAEVDTPHRLKLVYREEDAGPNGAEEWLLSHDEGVTHVRLIHSLPVADDATWDDTYPGIVRGWGLFLGTLRFVAERRKRLGRNAEVRLGDIAPGAWGRVLAAFGKEATPEAGERLSIGDLSPAEVLVSFDGYSLLLAFDDQATLLIDVEGDTLYTVAATYGDESAETADLRKRLVEIAELACRAAETA